MQDHLLPSSGKPDWIIPKYPSKICDTNQEKLSLNRWSYVDDAP